MTFALIIIAIVAIVAVAVALLNRHIEPADTATEPCDGQNEACGTCSSNYGSDECMSIRMLRQATEAPQYFDDEELDRFIGRAASSYDDAETEEFADVLYTMRPEEVPMWVASLNVRGINLPDSLRAEAALLMEKG